MLSFCHLILSNVMLGDRTVFVYEPSLTFQSCSHHTAMNSLWKTSDYITFKTPI